MYKNIMSGNIWWEHWFCHYLSMFLLFFVKFLKNICCAEMENKIFNTYFNSYFPFILHTWKPLECIILRLLPFCIMTSCYQNLTPLQIIFYYVAIFFQVTDIVKQSTIWPWNSSSPMYWSECQNLFLIL